MRPNGCDTAISTCGIPETEVRYAVTLITSLISWDARTEKSHVEERQKSTNKTSSRVVSLQSCSAVFWSTLKFKIILIKYYVFVTFLMI